MLSLTSILSSSIIDKFSFHPIIYKYSKLFIFSTWSQLSCIVYTIGIIDKDNYSVDGTLLWYVESMVLVGWWPFRLWYDSFYYYISTLIVKGLFYTLTHTNT